MKKLAAVAVAFLVVALAVVALVVRVAVVATVGNSMEPAFRAGDLAVLVPVGEYAVGDVVGYRSDELDTVVMHRIVDRDGDRYVLQGDNNDWLDPERPTREQLVGELAVRIPRGGVWLQRATTPVALAVVAFLLLLAGGGATVETGRRRRRGPVTAPEARPTGEHSRPDPTPSTHTASPATVGVGIAAGVALLLATLVALLTSGELPGSASELTYTHAGSFSYAADAPRGPVYPEGAVRSGETVFLQVVDDIEVGFDWRLRPPPGREDDVEVRGTGQLVLEVADGSGWRRELPLSDVETIDGSEARLEADIDLAEIQRLVEAVQRATGATSTSQSLTLTAELTVEGTVGGVPISDDLAPSVTFVLDPLRLQPPTAEEGGTLAFAEPRTVTVAGTQAAATVEVLGRSLTGATVRIVAVALAVVGLLLGGGWLLLRRRDRSRTAEEHIRARYGRRIVDAAGMAVAPGRTVVEVTGVDALVGLGERLNQPVLRVPTLDGGRTYVVDDGYTLYRHRPPAPATADRPTGRED